MGIQDTALTLLSSYLADRTFSVELGDSASKLFKFPCGVPQGSPLSPTLFNIYVVPLASIIRECGFLAVSYADNTQVVVSTSSNVEETADCFNCCMKQVNKWMQSNCLKLNSEKTEVMLLGSDSSLWTPRWWPASLGECPTPVPKVKNLGFIFDDKLTFNCKINKLSSTFWFILKMIRKIRPFIPHDALKTLVPALALSRLDYGNTLYMRIQSQYLLKLQRLQNAAARLVLDIPRFEPVSHRLWALHWLPVDKRITFKSQCLAFKALHGIGPQFSSTHLKWYVPAKSLRSAHSKLLQTPKFKQVRWGGRSFLLGTAISGTFFQSR